MKVETKGLLFDMDGVLISSIGSVERCWRRWAKIYDIPGADTYDVPHGMRAIDIVKMLRPDIDAAEGLRVIEDMEVEDTSDLRVLPGVRKLLEELPPERWAIVTSCTQRLLLGRLAAAGLPVPSRLISGDMVERGKPDPEPYRRGAALLGLAPEDCVVVEDAPSGVGAGLAAGCRVLGVLGTHSAEELREATWVAESLDKVRVVARGSGLEVWFDEV
jgi:sugar-phosphatase